MAYKNINSKVMYATLRGTGKLGNARIVDKVQLMRCKQSPYINYSQATVQQHDLATYVSEVRMCICMCICTCICILYMRVEHHVQSYTKS